MTLDDMIKSMKTDFPDEVKDSEKYFRMSVEAEKLGEDELAEYLFLMAKDEYTHAEFICDYLKSIGHTLPEADMKKWKEYHDEVHEMFQ